MNKRTDLSSLIDTCNADIVALTETWLSPSVTNDEILECNVAFNIYRCDRDNRQGGGVLIAVSDHLHSYVVPTTCSLELICVCVRINHRNIIFCCCYRPPVFSSSFCTDLHDTLSYVIARFPYAPLFLLGDFNFPSIKWSSTGALQSNLSRESSEFVNLCHDFHLSQVITEPTRTTSTSANILDLVLTTFPDMVHEICFLPGLSDHTFVYFTIHGKVKHPVRQPKLIRDYNRADFAAINRELSVFLDDYMLKFEERSVETNWNIFKDKVASLVDRYIPLRAISGKHRSPWFTSSLNRLLNRKKRAFKKAKQSNESSRWSAYRECTTQYKEAVEKAKETFYKNTLPSLLVTNAKKFWNVVGGHKQNIISLSDSNGVPIPSSECCSVLNHVFSKSFLSSAVSFPCITEHNFPVMDPVVIDFDGVQKLIRGLNLSSSCGVDGITPKFLKSTDVYSSMFLSKLFSQSLESCSLPRDWKVGKVVPLFKSGDAQSPFNYRPISLTSVPCKLLEHIIYSHLVTFLDTNSFFSPNQHGFRKHFSCETQLVSFTHDLFAALDSGLIIDCIFLDFSKAFDLVSHQLLCFKLSKLNIDRNILRWIEYFLANRTQFVTTNNNNSQESPVTSGVPQGSVLGPLLFLVYINDLPNNILSSIKLFADDCVIYRNACTNTDANFLQQDLNEVSSWCTRWNMRLNANKCKVMRVSRTSSSIDVPEYLINDSVLESVSCYKYLGVKFTSNLSWHTHVTHVTNNANRTLGYLRRHFSRVPSALKLILYKTLVRPKLEYASAVWDPGTNTLVETLESVQNRSARFILSDYARTSSVSSMKTVLGLPLLCSRRKVSRLVLFYKIYHNPQLKQDLLSKPHYMSYRCDHPHKVHIPFSHTKFFHDSFIPTTSNEWNHLPSSVAQLTDVTAFKAAVECDVYS